MNSNNNVTAVNKDKSIRAISCSDGDASRSSIGSNGTQQSVLTSRHGHGLSLSSAAQDEAATDAKKRNKKFRRVMAGADVAMDNNNNNNKVVNHINNGEADGTNNSVRISDGDSIDGLESDESS